MGRPTFSSPVYQRGVSSLAVDGNSNPVVGHGSCTHTVELYQPWLAVELDQITTLLEVHLTNRASICGIQIHVF